MEYLVEGGEVVRNTQKIKPVLRRAKLQIQTEPLHVMKTEFLHLHVTFPLPRLCCEMLSYKALLSSVIKKPPLVNA